jgi:hypothetical protein
MARIRLPIFAAPAMASVPAKIHSSCRWTKGSMTRVEAVHEAMVALQAPPPLSRWNVWLCVVLAAVLVTALIASQNGGINAFLARLPPRAR